MANKVLHPGDWLRGKKKVTDTLKRKGSAGHVEGQVKSVVHIKGRTISKDAPLKEVLEDKLQVPVTIMPEDNRPRAEEGTISVDPAFAEMARMEDEVEKADIVEDESKPLLEAETVADVIKVLEDNKDAYIALIKGFDPESKVTKRQSARNLAKEYLKVKNASD